MMTNHRKNILTIIMPCYNAEDFLKECFDSLSSQTVSNYDILFIDDGSSDTSLKIARSYFSIFENFKILNNDKNKGLVNCCNRALNFIDTPYFIRLDVDDYLPNDAIEKIYKEINCLDNEKFIVFNRWDVLNGKTKRTRVIDDIYSLIAVGTVFQTKAVRTVNGYSDEYWEEYDLYIKLLEAGYKYKKSSEYIYFYRRGHQSITRDNQKVKNGLKLLIDKWGRGTLKKYGDYNKLLKYYES